MKWQKATMIVMAVMTAVLIVWDIFVVVDGGTESSISYIMVKWGKEFPALTFGCGFLAGHFFFPLRKYPWKSKREKELEAENNMLKLELKKTGRKL